MNPTDNAAETEHPQGLSPGEVADRLGRGLVNRPPRSDWADYRAIVARNLFTLFNALVVPAAVALFLLQDYRGAWAVSGMALINAVIGLAQEIRAKRHLDKLAILTEARVQVLRDGQVCSLPASEVVQDDILLLATGESIVADGPVLHARFLEVDESLLTGESDPVACKPGDRLLSGSFCVAGKGAYRAERVGSQSFAHQTSAQARRYQFTASPMQRAIDLLLQILTGIAVGLCLLYVFLFFLQGFSEDDLVRMVAATVTSMVPQGLVLMTTLAFTLGAVRMSSRGAVVQRLNAVESMASVEVLCMDKTGTLTTSHLSLDRLQALGNQLEEEEIRGRLRLFAWASTDERSKSIQALRAGLGPVPAGSLWGLLDQIPFKSQNRFSAVRLQVDGEEWSLVLGAFEALRPGLDPKGVVAAERAWRELLPLGLRLLLFAEAKKVTGHFSSGKIPDTLQDMQPLALVALSDELRPEAGPVLEALAAQGLTFKILSGDNPETVRATVAHLQLPLAHVPVISGDQLNSGEQREPLLLGGNVFGRVTPQQKLEIVETLQRQGRRVAMIGDGINDILPIKRADLGIAMGEGSPATRTVAGLVLETNNFDLLPQTLDEGRTILRNLRRAAKLFLLKNVYTLILIVAALGIFHLPFPYLPQQVTLLNFLTIGIPAFFIMFGRHPTGQPIRTGFLREVGWFAISSGLAIGGAGLLVFWLAARWFPDDEARQRTLLLSTLVLLGLGNVLRLLADREGQPASADRWLYGWVALALPLYLGVMYLAPLAYFFELSPLTPNQWGLVLAVALPTFLITLVRWFRWKSMTSGK